WPAFAYVPLTVLIARRAAEGAAEWRRWIRIGVVLAAIATIVLHMPEVIRLAPGTGKIPGKWEELFGWRDMARAVEAVGENSTVYATTYETASELRFYLPGHPQVWTIATERP